MDQITRILEKLNQGRSDQQLTLADFMPMSLAEVRSLAGSRLSREEAQLLHRAAIKEKQNNILYTARALTRANPLLRKEMGAARNHGAAPYGYNDIIMPRTDEFAAPGAVSSMFSPAGYLTELYREARSLHQKESVNNLDKRRPDLAKLVLSQKNLDNEISTLSLANEQLETALMAKAGQTNKAKYYETLATSRRSGVTPYNMPFEGIRNALEQQDFVLPDNVLSKGVQSAAQMALAAGISPELYAILTEKTDGLSEAETEALLKKNFPGVNTDSLMNLDALANYYGLPRDEIQEMLEKHSVETPDAYKNNKLVTPVINIDGKIRLSEISKEDNKPTYADYLDVIPLGGKQFLVNFSVNKTVPQFTDFYIINNDFSNKIYQRFHFIPLQGVHYSIPVTINTPFKGQQLIGIVRDDIGGEDPAWRYSHNNFILSDTTPAPGTWLLTLNKTLRLAKATGMTPPETQRALTRLNTTGKFSDATVLHRFCEFLLYRKRYNISTDDALILSGAYIGTVSYDGQLSQFDRMFNNPPLNGEVYSLGGEPLDLTYAKDDKRLRNVYQALQVSDPEFGNLFWILEGNSFVNNTIDNTLQRISELYLIKLLAVVHGITINQLRKIYLGSPDNRTEIKNINDTQRRRIINYLWQTTQWLATQNISADTLSILQRFSAPDKPTKEMSRLLDALRHGGIDNKDTNTLYATMAPVIAGVMRLENSEQGEALLRWLDNNHPDKVPLTKDFWIMLIEDKTPELQANWCQALAQRVLLIRSMALSSIELQILSRGAPVNTVAELREISEFHRLVNLCGENANVVLEKIQGNSLSTSDLQKYSGIPYQISDHVLQINGFGSSFKTWQQLAKLPAYIDIADTLHILPKEFNNLLSITEKTAPAYDELTTLSGQLQAGLNKQQTKQLQDQSEPRRSEALSGEYRSLIMGKPLVNRDDIWRNLLVDGKVSAAITTTRLADAIAGIQLYINRTIAGDEPGASSAVLERQFFKDWDTYNKRYSTWAGVSQLVYYPENFIDPTIRTGQTGMMNTMLEQLSQSELNSDTLENGFRQYLTAFEQVADLKVISGYHDAVDIDEGNTWFIGTSQTEPKKYYWRKADHSKCQNGRFAANAWSDWKEITCAVNPYQDMVRPVIYRSRLYLLWVEEQVRKDEDGKKDISVFSVKLTHIKYDGSWASPFSYDVSGKLKSTSENPGLYCSTNPDDNTLTVVCYQKDDQTSTAEPKVYFSLFIQQDMTSTDASGLTGILTLVKAQLDTVSVVKVNTFMHGKYRAEFSQLSQDGNTSLNLTLSPGHYSVDKNNFLTLTPDAYITIDADEFFSRIGSNIRYYFVGELNSHNGTVYIPESIKYQRLRDPFPDGNATLAILRSNSSEYNEMGLTITGKTSWHEPESFFVYNKKNGYVFTMKPIDKDETNHSMGYCSDDRVDKEHFCSDATQYTFHAALSSDYEAELNTGKLIKLAEPISTDNIRIDFIASDGNIFKTIKGSDTKMTAPKYHESGKETLCFAFGALSLKLPGESNKKTITVKVSYTGTEPLIASTRYQLTLEKPKISERVISLYTTEDGAQYMEWDAYRTRLNTLFARQLIERANRGIEAVLSPETQNLREPKPGQGTYVTLTLKPYDPAIHGSDRKFTIYAYHVLQTHDQFPVYTGTLNTDNNTTITLFCPYMHNASGNKNNFYLQPEYQSGKYKYGINLARTKVNDPNGWYLNKDYYGGTFPGLESVSGLSQPDEPMDFSGANALYFWELFYYTPMMVAMRLLQEQNFTEANRWLSYIWQPAASGAGDWRVRPLLEDTSWNADPLDSVDPDAVAQNDPMHYKVSTLMKLLDLLIARGDSAYRMLERDTLNEAKMWYMQALGLLGDKPITIIGSNWGNPALSDAADQTKTKQRQDMISGVRNGGLLPDVRTANTLTGLFRPQQNEKLLGYWQTLEMRLFNLRNNLSIDGQPLSLPIFAAPADPAALLSAAAAASGGSKALPSADIPAMRFPQALESARSLTGQLMQFGSTLQGLIERQDAEAMSELLQNQAGELMLSSLRMQEQTLSELDAEKKTLEQSRAGAQSRFDSYRALYDENVSAAEKRTMDLYLSSAVLSTSIGVLDMAAAAADMVPNVFGLAVGGSRWGGIPKAIGSGIGLAASATKITADNISQSEAWRRRRQEWEIQKNNAESEVKQIDAQLEALAVRRTATEMQREHLEIQQAQTQAQLEFLQRKFSNKALYSWLRGRLASIYYRFYDLTATRCMMAEAAFAWQTGETTRYIKPGAWQSNNAGLMAGESLLLNLTEMEQAWLKWNHRTLKVTRTVSLAKVYKGYDTPVNLTEKIADLLKGSGSGDTPAPTGLSMTKDKQLHAAFNLKALNIAGNYPAGLGKTRRIKQISVTLPALTGPYQDVRAVLSYGGDVRLPDGCKAIAVSHGMNDDGQFRLDFNDGHWLPFEGIPVDNDSSLTLSFPETTDEEQKALLLSLSDIIIHIRYTIR